MIGHISSMNRQRLLLGLGIGLLAAGWLYLVLRPSWFERTFDEHLAHFPLAASLAARDPRLREIFLQQTEEAFNKAGWRAANGALRSSLASEVEIYADDEHINAISRAMLPVLLKLKSRPLLCKSYSLAGAGRNEFRQAAREIEQLGMAHLAAAENGFNRKTRGNNWTKPSDREFIDISGQLSRGPVEMLTQAELKAEANYLNGEPELLCSASIKRQENLLAMDSYDAARAQRVLLANTATVNLPLVLSRLCREQNSGLTCP